MINKVLQLKRIFGGGMPMAQIKKVKITASRGYDFKFFLPIDIDINYPFVFVGFSGRYHPYHLQGDNTDTCVVKLVESYNTSNQLIKYDIVCGGLDGPTTGEPYNQTIINTNEPCFGCSGVSIIETSEDIYSSFITPDLPEGSNISFNFNETIDTNENEITCDLYYIPTNMPVIMNYLEY